jgi:hypothetical protein
LHDWALGKAGRASAGARNHCITAAGHRQPNAKATCPLTG